MIILRLDDEQSARDLFARDPLVGEGYVELEIYRFTVGLADPATGLRGACAMSEVLAVATHARHLDLYDTVTLESIGRIDGLIAQPHELAGPEPQAALPDPHLPRRRLR